jgi:anti-sigma regulatory factor (Ser/Thr protein kinase)
MFLRLVKRRKSERKEKWKIETDVHTPFCPATRRGSGVWTFTVSNISIRQDILGFCRGGFETRPYGKMSKLPRPAKRRGFHNASTGQQPVKGDAWGLILNIKKGVTEMANEANFVSSIRVKAQRKVIPAVTAFVREMVHQEGLDLNAARQLEVVVEEACLNVIDHAFDGDEKATFDIIVERWPGKVVLAVVDQGLPVDWMKIGSGETSGFGMMIMKGFTDEVKFINLGKGGKRLEFIKNIPFGGAGEPLAASPPKDEILSQDMPIAIRLMRPDEGIALAQCFYRVYGYTYGEFLYYPEKIKELIESGLQISLCAATPTAEIVAHQALVLENHDSRVAEMGQGVVDPRARGRGLFEKIKVACQEWARQRGILGLYTETVTIHPYSQKANLVVGAREMGFLFGMAPKRFSFKKIAERQDQRQTTIILYHRTNEEPMRTIYPPVQHETMIRRIYENGSFHRILSSAPPASDLELADVSLLDLKTLPDYGFAYMRVTRYGRDLADLVRVRLRELCLGRYDCIYIDLPLGDPATAHFCAALELLGFFFAGVIPEMFNGDSLRLQYLNNVSINPAKVVVVSDFGKELFKYIQDCNR